MVPLLQSLQGKQTDHGISMERLYRYAGISRQGFHQAVVRLGEDRGMFHEIERLVNEYREDKDRRAGSRSLFYNLNIKSRFNIGVNKFEQMLSANGLSLMPLRIRVVTTKSSMQSWNYSNLVNGLTINDINQVVVGDLTYVYLGSSKQYLFCLTDVYSSRMVGYHIGDSMRAVDANTALVKWKKLRGKKNIKGSIHHSDGGSQYFSALYLGELHRLRVRVSCAENCLRNGYAEQRNGLIKHHLIPTIKMGSLHELDKEMERIMYIYNYERKQEKLGWLSPVEFEEKISKMDKKPELNLYKFKNPWYGFFEA